MAVALATDLNPGTCYCESMPFMMALACRFMRLTPAEALVASTVNAAFAIGKGAALGRLQPGYQADAAVLDGNDYRLLAYRFGTNPVYAVIKKGKIVYCADGALGAQSRPVSTRCPASDGVSLCGVRR